MLARGGRRFPTETAAARITPNWKVWRAQSDLKTFSPGGCCTSSVARSAGSPTNPPPASRDFKHRDQIRDSSDSAHRNVAEGFVATARVNSHVFSMSREVQPKRRVLSSKQLTRQPFCPMRSSPRSIRSRSVGCKRSRSCSVTCDRRQRSVTRNGGGTRSDASAARRTTRTFSVREFPQGHTRPSRRLIRFHRTASRRRRPAQRPPGRGSARLRQHC